MLRNLWKTSFRYYSTHKNLVYNSDTKKVLWFDAKNTYEDVGVRSYESLLKYLLANKLFENEKIVVYNKPTGIEAHHQRNSPDCLAIEGLLHMLAQETNSEFLKICDAPHSSYSGVMILGKSDEACQAINSIFHQARRRNHFLRKDVALTWGVPHPSHGAITAPVREDQNGVLMPVFSPSHRQIRFNFVRKMRTLYEVLDAHKGAALVELKPRDSMGQISLIHLTCKMCRVIGDKIYARHLVNIRGVRMFTDSPGVEDANLSWNIRKRLHMTSAEQYENLPLLMHRYSVTLPATASLDLPKELTLTAAFPNHFLTALQLLELKFPNT